MSFAWEQHYQTYGDALVLYARQFTPVQTEAEDIVHDAFLQLFSKRKNRKHPNPKALLFQAVRWAALNKIRGDKRRQKRENEAVSDLFQSETIPFPGVENEEFSAIVSKLLRQLPEEQREVLVLHLWGELTFREIGEQLDISPNTAASRYRYGLEQLRSHSSELREAQPENSATLTIE